MARRSAEGAGAHRFRPVKIAAWRFGLTGAIRRRRQAITVSTGPRAPRITRASGQRARGRRPNEGSPPPADGLQRTGDTTRKMQRAHRRNGRRERARTRSARNTGDRHTDEKVAEHARAERGTRTRVEGQAYRSAQKQNPMPNMTSRADMPRPERSPSSRAPDEQPTGRFEAAAPDKAVLLQPRSRRAPE